MRRRPESADSDTRRRLLGGLARLLAGAAPLAVGPAVVRADDRSIALVVPGHAGTAGDAILRLFAEQLQLEVARPVALLNRPGGNGIVATGDVARASPDGTTLGYAHVGTLVVNAGIHPRLPYDPDRDFEPVALLGHVALVAVVRPELPADSMAELAQAARRSPRGLAFGSLGHGSSAHLAGEWFATLADARLTHVPYGDVGLYRDLSEGRIDLAFLPAPTVLPLLRGRRVRALAVTQARRTPLLPQVPAAGESGMARMDVIAWGGLVAPARTPPGIVESLNAAVNRTLATPQLHAQLERLGMEPHIGPPADLADLARAERTRWLPLLRRAASAERA